MNMRLFAGGVRFMSAGLFAPDGSE